MNTDLNQLLEKDRAFSTLSEKKGASYAYSKFLTQNSLMLANNQKPIRGINNITLAMKTDKNEVLTWKPQDGLISKSKDFGYTWGFYTVSLTNGKKIKGKYLNIWSKQANGVWKVMVDMGNLNPQ